MTARPDDFDRRLYLLPKPNRARHSSYGDAYALAFDLLFALRAAQIRLKGQAK